MDLRFSAADEAFREEVRSFIADAFDPELRSESARVRNHYLPKHLQQRWHNRLYEKGWVAPHWPREWGGTDWTLTQEYIFEREAAAVGAPHLSPYGLRMIGPLLMKYGTEAQKVRHLPAILKGEIWWCQGYSEPGAGSDLAAVQLKAENKGDHYLLNGSKIWTSEAQHADMIFCLTRTAWREKRQDGITFLLVDMHSDGVSIEPIITLDMPELGHHEVNQVFFDDVKVPIDNRVGEEDRGWTYAKYLLEFERAEPYAGLLWAAHDRIHRFETETIPGFSTKLASVASEIAALEMTELRILSQLSNGQNMGPESSLLKCRGSELQLTLSELALEAVGLNSVPFQPLVFGQNEPSIAAAGTDHIAPAYFNTRKVAIYSGSNEIQRNIIAKSILGLS